MNSGSQASRGGWDAGKGKKKISFCLVLFFYKTHSPYEALRVAGQGKAERESLTVLTSDSTPPATSAWILCSGSASV